MDITTKINKLLEENGLKEGPDFTKSELQDARNMLMLYVRKQNRSKKTLEKFSTFMKVMSQAEGELKDKAKTALKESGIKSQMISNIFNKAIDQVQASKLDTTRKYQLIQLMDTILMDLDLK